MADNENSIDVIAKSLIVDSAVPVAAVKRIPTPLNPIATEETEEVATEENENVQEVEATENETPEVEEEVDDEEVDLDSVEIDVPVDGETKKVTLKDLKAKFAGEGAIEKRLQEASEVKTHVMQQSQYLDQALQFQMGKLQQLDKALAETMPKEPDWETLKRTDPGRYLLERDNWMELSRKRETLNNHYQQAQVEQQRLNAVALQERASEEAKVLVAKIPELKDAAKAPAILAGLVETGKHYGFSPKEIDDVVDSRAMLVLHDAMKYRELMANKKTPAATVSPALRPLLRPAANSARNAVTSEKKAERELYNKAKASGRPDDVAKLLISRAKSGKR